MENVQRIQAQVHDIEQYINEQEDWIDHKALDCRLHEALRQGAFATEDPLVVMAKSICATAVMDVISQLLSVESQLTKTLVYLAAQLFSGARASVPQGVAGRYRMPFDDCSG